MGLLSRILNPELEPEAPWFSWQAPLANAVYEANHPSSQASSRTLLQPPECCDCSGHHPTQLHALSACNDHESRSGIV